ncbi:MAG: hypothetical protein ABW175_11685 [Bradyrhizobium sp.]
MTTANDDKSPLIDLLTCPVCNLQMTISQSFPEASGSDLVRYRCDQCGGIETIRLIRRIRDPRAQAAPID